MENINLSYNALYSVMEKILSKFDIAGHLWDSSGKCLAPGEPVRVYNLFRRTLVIMYILLQKKGIMPKVSFGKKQPIGFFNKYLPDRKIFSDRLLFCDDLSYTSIYTTLFRHYGWDFPQKYTYDYHTPFECLEEHEWIRKKMLSCIEENFGFPEDVYEVLADLDIQALEEEPVLFDKLRKKYDEPMLFKESSIGDLEENLLSDADYVAVCNELLETAAVYYQKDLLYIYSSKFSIYAYHNAKLDLVHKIREQKGALASEELCSDYEHILGWVNKIFECIPLDLEGTDIIQEGGTYNYIAIFKFPSYDMLHSDSLDIYVIAEPRLMFLLPIINDMMDSFIVKWHTTD